MRVVASLQKSLDSLSIKTYGVPLLVLVLSIYLFMQDNLTFNLKGDDEIALPAAILDGELSLAEIGMLFLLVGIWEGVADFGHPRFESDNEEITKLCASLKERGVFDVKVVGKTVKVNVDIEKACPVQEDDDEN